jgi:hypothetical protein
MSNRFMGLKRPDPMDAGCWAVVRQYSGSLWAGGANCGKRPRPGFLTCRHHAAHEAEARRCRALYTPEGVAEMVWTAQLRVERMRALVEKEGAEIAAGLRPKPKGPSPRSQGLSSALAQLERAQEMTPIIDRISLQSIEEETA